MDLSIVIPVYNEESNIEALFKKLKEVLDSLKKKYEIIFVDDGSRDNTFNIIKNLHKQDKKVRGISFRRNFGKASALSAGFKEAKGNIIITMDGDLQEDPQDIPRFLDSLRDNDLVVGWKRRRKDSVMKKISSKIFNFLLRRLTKVKLHDFDCNYRAMKKEVVKNLNIYGGLYRFIPVFAHSRGYKVKEIKILHHRRLHGKSKYKITRLFGGILDLITIKFLLDYTKKPLHFLGSIGTISSFIGFIVGIYLLYVRYGLHEKIGHRPLLILAILLIVIGIQFISLGLLAEMLVSAQQKPEDQYVIKEKLR